MSDIEVPTITTSALLLRATYFAKYGAPRSVREVAEACVQLREYLNDVDLLNDAISPRPSEALAGQIRAHKLKVISIEMRSPLAVVLEVPAETVPVLGLSLILLAERVATFGPRVSRRRKEELVRAAKLDHELSTTLAAKADMLAKRNLEPFANQSRPDRIDLLDAEEPDEELDDLPPLIPDA